MFCTKTAPGATLKCFFGGRKFIKYKCAARGDVLIFFLSALLPEFAIRYKIGSMTSHSISLFSPLHANISKAILLWTIKHHFMSEKPHDHAAVVCRVLPKFTSAAEMISQSAARLDWDVTRCVAHIHKMTPSSPAAPIVFLGAIVSRRNSAARFYNLFNLAGQIIFIYIQPCIPTCWLAGPTFYAPHEIYLVINQNSSSLVRRCPLFVSCRRRLTRTNERSEIINSKDPGWQRSLAIVMKNNAAAAVFFVRVP